MASQELAVRIAVVTSVSFSGTRMESVFVTVSVFVMVLVFVQEVVLTEQITIAIAIANAKPTEEKHSDFFSMVCQLRDMNILLSLLIDTKISNTIGMGHGSSQAFRFGGIFASIW
jgi:hypothetical protein